MNDPEPAGAAPPGDAGAPQVGGAEWTGAACPGAAHEPPAHPGWRQPDASPTPARVTSESIKGSEISRFMRVLSSIAGVPPTLRMGGERERRRLSYRLFATIRSVRPLTPDKIPVERFPEAA